MTTPISGSTSASVQTTTPTEVTTTQVTRNSQTASSLEETVSALANSLTGYTSRCMQQPTGHPRMFARMERLVDSISRLIDAIANYRNSTKSEAATPTEQALIQERSALVTEAGSAVIPPTTEGSVGTAQVVTTDPTPTPEVAPPAEAAPEAEVVAQDSVSTNPSGINLGAQLPPTGGFLWKPTSDKNGELVILLPKQYTGKVKQVRILNPNGTKALAKGKFSGVANGDREHYRFNKPGSAYPDGATVLIEMENGAIRHFTIKDTGKRTER